MHKPKKTGIGHNK
jgi:hypothetical protein